MASLFKYPLSPSRIDGYKYFANNEFKEFAEYLAELCGEVQTPAMTVGKDFHRWIQGKTHRLQWKNPNFLETPRCLYNEVPKAKYIKVRGHDVRVLGYADGIDGNTIREYKTTSKGIDLEKYMDSFQWRLYLWLFEEVERVVYHVYRYNISKDGMRCAIVAYHTVQLNRYAGLDADVQGALSELVAFLESCEREGYIQVVDDDKRGRKIVRGAQRPPLPEPPPEQVVA